MTLLAALCVSCFFVTGSALLTRTGPDRFHRPIVEPEHVDPLRRHFRSDEPALRPVQWIAAALLVGLTSFGLLSLITGSAAIAIPVSVALGVSGPSIWLDRRQQAWRRRQLQAWPEAIRELVGGITSARSLHQSLVGLSVNGPDQIRPLFERYATLAQSLDSRQALEAVRDELADPVTDRVLEILIVAFDAGPAVMLNILRDLADSISEDLHLVRRVDVANTEEKTTAWMTVVLPFAMLLLLVFMGGDSYHNYYQGFAGFIVVSIGTGLSAASFFIVAKLSKTEREPRLFTGGRQ